MWLTLMRHIVSEVEFVAYLVVLFGCVIVTALVYPPIPGMLILAFLYWRLPK